jgi:type II secretory pathway pseudopilin PulG
VNDTSCSSPDHGATLVELVIVVMVVGLISTALSTTVFTLLRVTPQITATVDHSRAALDLLSAIERDVGSTPPAGVDVNATAGGCSGADPGTNLLQLTWNDGTLVRRAAYRLRSTVDETWVERHTCSGGSLNTLVAGPTSRVAGDLVTPAAAATRGTVPVRVTTATHVITVVLTRPSGSITFSARLQTQLGVLP